jgi:iron-sulfur cluster assembly protein
MITVTDKAAEKVTNYLTKRGKGEGIRIGVKTTGCSGYSYNLEFVDSPSPEDEVYEDKGVKLFVDPKSLLFVAGMEIDYTKEGFNEGFKFNNPNAKAECGCGESFTV